MAQVCGPFDRRHSYGLVTTFYSNPRPLLLSEYIPFLTTHYADLEHLLNNGYNIRIPSPSPSLLQQCPDLFFNENKQVVFHTLGTGIADLSQEFLLGIQAILDRLAPRESSVDLASNHVESSVIVPLFFFF